MIRSDYSFGDLVKTSEKVAFKLEDVVFGKSPDLGKNLLPDILADIQKIEFLSASEKLKLNQIRGNSYLYLFGFIEEPIIVAISNWIRTQRGDKMQLRSLMRFVEEEVKHQQMFQAFNQAFEAKFGSPCLHLGERVTAEDVAAMLTKNSPLSVLITILHLELVTQRHYVECIREDGGSGIDPFFTNILKNHWMEEVQHAKADVLIIAELVAKMKQSDIDAEVEGYMEIGKAVDGLLYQQIELDIQSLEKAIGRRFSKEETDHLLFCQSSSCRKGMLGMGMTNPPFVKFLNDLSPIGSAKVAAMASAIG